MLGWHDPTLRLPVYWSRRTPHPSRPCRTAARATSPRSCATWRPHSPASAGSRSTPSDNGPRRTRNASSARASPPRSSPRGPVTTTAKVPTDIAIAQAAKLRPVADIAAELGLAEDEVERYGKYKAKVRLAALARRKPKGRLVLVTGINPTPAGEGKSTVTVGVTQALRKIGRNAALCIREPSLGPVFRVKGGAAGGREGPGVPMEDLNLPFTGDFHAIPQPH